MAARAGFSGYDKKSTSNDLGNKSNEVSAESTPTAPLSFGKWADNDIGKRQNMHRRFLATGGMKGISLSVVACWMLD